MSEKNITISVNRYASLLRKEAKLQALDDGGVDNWDWYGESLSDYRDACDDGEFLIEAMKLYNEQQQGRKERYPVNISREHLVDLIDLADGYQEDDE